MEPLPSNNKQPVNYFGNFKTTYKVLGISFTGNESLKYRIFSAIMFFAVGVYLVLYTLELVFQSQTGVLLNSILYEFAAVMAYAKAYVSLRNRFKLKKMLDSFEQEPFLPSPERGVDEQMIVDRCVWVTNIQFQVYFILTSCSVGLGIITAIVKRIQSDDYRDWVFTYGKFTVVNVTYSPNYEISWFYQTFCMNMNAYYFIVTDIFVATILAHISLQFRLLQGYIRNIVNITYKKMEKDGIKMLNDDGHTSQEENPIIPWEYLKASLKGIVEYHMKILDIADEVETIYGTLLLLVILSTLGALALFVYNTLILNDARALHMAVEAVCWCLQIAFICFWGEEVIHESKLVGDAAYEVNFVGTDLRFQKGLAFIMRRSQDPTIITANKFGIICLATFLWIMRAAYSAYMVLHSTR